MRIKQAGAKRGGKGGLAGAVMGLALVAGALLSMGGFPTKNATSPREIVKPEAAALASDKPENLSPGPANAERDILELQLD